MSRLIVYTALRMCKYFALLFSISLASNGANIQSFYLQSAFQNAVGSGGFTTKSFTGNQINTPGLTITDCSYFTNPATCQNVPGPSNAYGGSLFGNQYTDAIGRYITNTYGGQYLSGNETYAYVTLPHPVLATGFDIAEQPEGDSAFLINGLTPFGGTSGGFANPSYSYTGFFGFISDTPFDTITFSTFAGAGVAYQLDNLTFGDPTPEPASIVLGALGILVVAAALRRRSRDASAFR